MLPKEAELQKAGVTLRKRAKQSEAQVAAAEKDYQPKQAASLAATKMLSEKERTASEVGEQAKQLKVKIADLTVQMRETRFNYQAQNQHVTLLVNRISDIRLMGSYGGFAVKDVVLNSTAKWLTKMRKYCTQHLYWLNIWIMMKMELLIIKE